MYKAGDSSRWTSRLLTKSKTMTTKKKSKIPPATVADLLYKSKFQCVVCQKEDIQIHHVNGKNDDHRIDNLACLCHPHHEKATLNNSLYKTLTKEAVIKFREKHYQRIEKSREAESKQFDNPITKLTEEKLLT